MTIQIAKQESGYVLLSTMRLPSNREEIFAFFANARNLEALTPDSLNFRVLTPDPIVMSQGALIDYQLKIRGLPVRWQSEITIWDPPYQFVDVQRRGPYRWWVHKHVFREENGETIITDEVRYGVKGGGLIHGLLVAPELRRIFQYRHNRLEESFSVAESLIG